MTLSSETRASVQCAGTTADSHAQLTEMQLLIKHWKVKDQDQGKCPTFSYAAASTSLSSTSCWSQFMTANCPGVWKIQPIPDILENVWGLHWFSCYMFEYSHVFLLTS